MELKFKGLGSQAATFTFYTLPEPEEYGTLFLCIDSMEHLFRGEAEVGIGSFRKLFENGIRERLLSLFGEEIAPWIEIGYQEEKVFALAADLAASEIPKNENGELCYPDGTPLEERQYTPVRITRY